MNSPKNAKIMMIRKFLGIFSALALIVAATGCGDDNNGNNPTGSVTRTIKVLNHIVNNASSEEQPYISTNDIDYTFDRANQSVTALTLRVKLNGSDVTTIKLSDIQSSTSGGVCSIKAKGSGVTELKGRLDLNEGTLRVNYILDGKYRVIATTPELFSNNCPTACSYSDGSTSQNNNTVYQFNIDPEALTAKVIIGSLIDQSMKRTISTIKSDAGASAKVTVTASGYEIEAVELPTTATYILNGKSTTTKAYPIADLKAIIDLENSKFDATLQLGSISLTANGSVSN